MAHVRKKIDTIDYLVITPLIPFFPFFTPPALLLAGYYGALSDRKGRRLVLKISCFGNILLILSYIITIKFPGTFGISLLFITPVVRGLMAGDNVLIATAQAYISDCTTANTR